MAETIDTKDYYGSDRRADTQGGSIVYKNFPELTEKGFELRALQQAQRIVHCFTSQKNVVVARRTISSEWQRVATVENGFRKGDQNLSINDPFRKSVIRHTADMLITSTHISTAAKPGMPRSHREEAQTNEIKEAIRKKLLGRIRTYERKNRWKTLCEKLIQKTMEKLIGWQGINPQDGAEEAGLRTAIAETGIDEKTLGGIIGILGELITHGTHGLLRKIAEEEELREAGTIPETTLEQSRVARWLFHFPAKNFIAGDTLAESFENEFVRNLLDAGIEITVAHEIESTFDTAQAEKNLKSFLNCVQTLGGPQKNSCR